ncbi:sulfurtransferase [Aquimarina sp. 2201CG14-23]|uniref:sulfurtransferase n=1 Tax=Aquimarina mycalae TaxID=3040073 RepID=UPI002477DFBC|nr:sulfurtransferase [Aquimarina sp. 2201CG14-23]MDH7447255.1 sulfurtransferase [Aquimarina sp. 2201CG14-23]
MTTLQLPTPLVSVDWLSEHLDHPDLIILDASIKKVTTNTSTSSDIQIIGARFFDIKKSFSDQDTDLPNMLPSANNFEKSCRKLGINTNSKIVIYDTIGIYSSPRAWWMLSIMGHKNIAVLDGGLPEWIRKGFSTENKSTITNYPKGNFKVNDRSKCVVNAEEVLFEMNSTNSMILDARSYGRYKGIDPEPRSDLKGGHIPNALSLPYTEVLEDGKMLPVQELRTLFANFDLENKKLIFSCGSGITACIILLAAQLSGYSNLWVYDGSWTEWGQLKGVPIQC